MEEYGEDGAEVRADRGQGWGQQHVCGCALQPGGLQQPGCSGTAASGWFYKPGWLDVLKWWPDNPETLQVLHTNLCTRVHAIAYRL